MKAFITGGAGFIGSHLADSLLSKNYQVIIFDNLSSGKKSHLPMDNPNLVFINGDTLEYDSVYRAMDTCDIVFHFAANADVRKGVQDTNLDINQGIIATRNVLEAMKQHGIKKIVFPSSMTVYGIPTIKTVAEDYGPCLPISLYASAKLGAEGLMSAYASLFGMQAWIFRFANVIGPRLTHGVMYDLIHKLSKDNKTLSVLGDGKQTKPYVYISDVIDAMIFTLENTKEAVNVYNIGVINTISVKEIVAIILDEMNLPGTTVTYGTTPYGWAGDVTQCSLDIKKLSSLGFSPRISTKKAVEMTVASLVREVGYRK